MIGSEVGKGTGSGPLRVGPETSAGVLFLPMFSPTLAKLAG